MGAGAHWDLWDADCSSRYTNWNEGEPNDDPKTGGDENCACISAEGEDNTWFDVPCYMPAACVCEQVGSAALIVPTAHTTWPPGGGLSRHLAAPLGASSRAALRVQWVGDCGTVMSSGRSRRSASFNAQVCEYGGSPPPCPHSDGEAGGGIGCGAVTVLLLLWSLVAGTAAGLRRLLTLIVGAPSGRPAFS